MANQACDGDQPLFTVPESNRAVPPCREEKLLLTFKSEALDSIKMSEVLVLQMQSVGLELEFLDMAFLSRNEYPPGHVRKV